MRKLVDPGLLLTLALTLFLALPLAGNAGLPDGHDLQIHAYRASEMLRSWEHGLFFPSWAEGTYFGYGSPIFHFYARLTYMLAAVLQVVFGLGTLDALRCFLLLGLLTCSGGMYLFCKRRSGRLGAIIAGLVYVYSPYLMYTETYARGAFPELLAFAVFPLALWRVDALRDRATTRNFLLVCLLQVALINSHNLMAAVLTVIATAWIAFETMIQRFNREASQMDSASGLLALMALGLGIAAASTFWLPVLLEGDSVHLQNLQVPAYLDFRENFVRIRELLAAPPLQVAGMSNGLRPIHQLGIAQWGLALLGGASGLLLYVRGYRTRHPETLLAAVFYGLLAVALISLVAPESRGVWDRIEPLQILQFPWRFLGPIAACLAIVASLNGLWLSRLQARYQVCTVAILSALPLVAAIPLLYVPNWQLTALDTSIAAYHQASELNPALLGTTATGEYLPRSTHSVPTSTESLLYDFADGHPIDRLNRKLFPPDAQAVLTGSSPQSNEWRIRSESSFVAEILLFYWLGWRAEVNGQTVAIQPSPHHGLITVALPAGESRLRVYLGSTPARDLAAAFSALAIVLACMVAWRLRGLRLTPRPYWTAAPLKPAQIFGILLASLIMMLCLLVSFGGAAAFLHSPPGEALPAQVRRKFTLDDKIQLLGYSVNGDSFRVGETLVLDAYWYAAELTEINFHSFLHFSSPEGGPPVAQVDKLHPADIPTSLWVPTGYILDNYELQLPADLPRGEYQLSIGLYTCELAPVDDCGNGYRPTVTNDLGEVIGDSIVIATIRVEAP